MQSCQRFGGSPYSECSDSNSPFSCGIHVEKKIVDKCSKYIRDVSFTSPSRQLDETFCLHVYSHKRCKVHLAALELACSLNDTGKE